MFLLLDDAQLSQDQGNVHAVKENSNLQEKSYAPKVVYGGWKQL
jgi:hypothetical protein